MYLNYGYLKNTRRPIKDKSAPLIVTSCGDYRLITKERFPTLRPRGRLDYQLLYVAAGRTHFTIGGVEHEVSAGNMVLFQPRQVQNYVYYGHEKPQVFWVHFTGSNVKNILRSYGVPLDETVFACGMSPAYPWLFKEIISELQTRRAGFEELNVMYLRQIFMQVRRWREEQTPLVSSSLQQEMESAARWFNEHYNEQISIEDFALSRGMSVSWFLRSFKRVMGASPMQYILQNRISNAAELLESSDFNVAEISAIVGYDNPLYFSRLFKKQRGVSPTEYRKKMRPHPNDVG